MRKMASSLVVEFTTREHANRAIREGLVIGACQHDTELYDRGCKLKQCYKCQRYGHIGTQRTADEICGYCAEPHNTRQCRKKEEDPNSTPKCALCKGPHTAWSNICQTRQTQLAKVEQGEKKQTIILLRCQHGGTTTTLRLPQSHQVHLGKRRKLWQHHGAIDSNQHNSATKRADRSGRRTQSRASRAASRI
jgi:hypothetical protein